MFSGGGAKREDITISSIFDSYTEFTNPAFEFIIDLELNGIKYDIDGNRKMASRMVPRVDVTKADEVT